MRELKVSGVLASLIVVMFLAPGMVGAEDGRWAPSEPLDVESLVRGVLGAPDPGVAYNKLTLEQQQVFTEALSNPEIEHTSSEMEHTSSTTQAYVRCKTHRYTRKATKFGITLWRFTTKTRFCYDGYVITNRPSVTYSKSARWPWRWVRLMFKITTGGQGQTSHDDFVRGEFKYCIAYVCPYWAGPYIHKTQYGNGNTRP